MVPSMITQPLVENALWHGLQTKEGDKLLVVAFNENNDSLIITIDDNGIGREKAAKIRNQKIGSSQFVSKGTNILQQRLNTLSEHLKVNIQLSFFDKIDDLGEATGTKVTITFPSNLEAE
jgi:LytS/YehU family sensor histidine kinase